MNILFICGHYAFPTAANSICVQNLAEELVRQGHQVYVLAKACEYTDQKEEKNGVKIWKTYGDAYSRVVRFFNSHTGRLWRIIFSIIQFVRYSFVVWFYPVTSPQDTPLMTNRAKLLINEKGIDTVVATFMPYEAIKSAIKLKKEYGNQLKVVTYHLDLMTTPNNDSAIIVHVKKYQVERALRREFATVDRILLPNTAPKVNDEKVRYVDFPLYLPEKNNIGKIGFTKPKDFNDESINIAIAGSLDSSNRNPIYFCDLLNQLAEINGKKVVLHIWGKINGIQLDKYSNVLHHGMANIEDVPIILHFSDFLLNVGNAITYKMIPSKIFQMFAAKKPIICCVRSEEDKSRPYFEKYGYTCFIEEYSKNQKSDLERLKSFIVDSYLKEVNVEDDLFIMSSPEYICEKILE